jgi:hypothetical protein
MPYKDSSKRAKYLVKFDLSDTEKIIDYFFERLRKRNIRIDNVDLAQQWIEQRIRTYKVRVAPRTYITSSYISHILTREFSISREQK